MDILETEILSFHAEPAFHYWLQNWSFQMPIFYYSFKCERLYSGKILLYWYLNFANMNRASSQKRKGFLNYSNIYQSIEFCNFTPTCLKSQNNESHVSIQSLLILVNAIPCSSNKILNQFFCLSQAHVYKLAFLLSTDETYSQWIIKLLGFMVRFPKKPLVLSPLLIFQSPCIKKTRKRIVIWMS